MFVLQVCGVQLEEIRHLVAHAFSHTPHSRQSNTADSTPREHNSIMIDRLVVLTVLTSLLLA